MQEIQEERSLEEMNSNYSVFSSSVLNNSTYRGGGTSEYRKMTYVSSFTNENNLSHTNNLVLITEEDCKPGMPRPSPKYIKLKNLGKVVIMSNPETPKLVLYDQKTG